MNCTYHIRRIWNYLWSITIFAWILKLASMLQSERTNIYSTFIPNITHWCKINLTYWGRVTHICVSKLTIIGSDNGLSPGRCQAIIWANAGLLLIGSLGTNFSEILIETLTFSFKKMHLKISSAKWRPFCHGLIVLNVQLWKHWAVVKPPPSTGYSYAEMLGRYWTLPDNVACAYKVTGANLYGQGGMIPQNKCR